MRTLTLSLMLGLAAGPALAQRSSTLGMTCAEAQSFVATNGAVVMSTGQFTYDRFVAHRGYCLAGEFIDYKWVPAADTPQCQMRICEPDWPLPFENSFR
jgi:hypothetical protein